VPEGGIVAEQIRQVRDICQSIRKDVDRHDNDLYRGNGKPGVCTRIEKTEDRVTTLERYNIDREKRLDKRMDIMIGAIFSLAVAVILQLIFKH
jgi:hypothetical protein